jgi:hypothetical protein
VRDWVVRRADCFSISEPSPLPPSPPSPPPITVDVWAGRLHEATGGSDVPGSCDRFAVKAPPSGSTTKQTESPDGP